MEILGKPPEHIMQGLKMLAEKIKAEKGIKVIEETHHLPVLVKDSKDIYTTFMEITLEVDNLNTFFAFLFIYMPANIDIIHPESLSMTNQEMNQASNHLVQRMHQYDAITKKMIMERDMAMKKLFEVAPHLFKKQEAQSIPNHQAQVKPEKKERLHKSKSAKRKK